MTISGNIIDIKGRQIIKGAIEVGGGRIISISLLQNVPNVFILPGFIDAHVHIESSMLVPSEFARMAVVHGTVSTVSDPHEIANVLGVEGVNYMIENGKQTPFKFNFGAPSCVPATGFETAGASIGVHEVDLLMQDSEVRYLAEMMNWPGVLSQDNEVQAKIEIAKKYGKPVDGHAPGLKGDQALAYASAGITTDHECFTSEEALDKLKAGMKILIREGSAAKNFDALVGLIDEHFANMMFCSDDKHPDSLEEGHINKLVARAVAKGIDLFKVLQVACINPISHYGLSVGQLQIGDAADFIVVDDLKEFIVRETYISGNKVAEHGKSMIPGISAKVLNNFSAKLKQASHFKAAPNGARLRVIEALDGQLVTSELIVTKPLIAEGNIVSDPQRDILKIAVVNRYKDQPVAIAFVKNFNLKKGAIASSVAHDSHNIIAVGADDESLMNAVNLVIESKGGIAVFDQDGEREIIPLPVAGLMSTEDGYKVAAKYKAIDKMAKDLGCTLSSPFMTLSFMALLVIPSLKLSDQGLFDGNDFQFKPVSF